MNDDFKHDCTKCINYGCALKMAGLIQENESTTCYGFHEGIQSKAKVKCPYCGSTTGYYTINSKTSEKKHYTKYNIDAAFHEKKVNPVKIYCSECDSEIREGKP